MDQRIAWLLQGDISIQYMTHRDLLGTDGPTLSNLQNRIASEGFGAAFLSRQNSDGHWGIHYYQPKWTSTHYTLLDLKNLQSPDTLEPCREMVTRMFDECQNPDGGLNLSKYKHPSDIAIDGMALNYAAYFGKGEPRLASLAAFLLAAQKADGGFTWNWNSESGDPHTTLCVLEGLSQYGASTDRRESGDVAAAIDKGEAYLLANGLFISDNDIRFRKLSYPFRYRYDLLRALEYFSIQHTPYDTRMQPALDWLLGKRKKDGLWHLENQHKGNTHFQMEAVGQPSRFITLKALVILKYFAAKMERITPQ